MKKLSLLFALVLSSTMLFNNSAQAQTEKPYTEGPVWVVSFVQTKPDMTEMYLKDMSEHWIKLMKVAKDDGIIMDYKVLQSVPAAKTDWDLMRMVEIKNYAALDDIDDKFDVLAGQLFGSEDTLHQSALSRNDMREFLGGKLAKELVFK